MLMPWKCISWFECHQALRTESVSNYQGSLVSLCLGRTKKSGNKKLIFYPNACILPTFQTNKCQTNPNLFILTHCIDFTDVVHNIYIWCSVGGTHGIGSTLTELGPSDVSFDFNLIWQQWQSLHNSFWSRTIWRTMGQGTRPRKENVQLNSLIHLNSLHQSIKLSSNGINSICSCQIFSHNLSWLSFFSPALHVFTLRVRPRLRGLTREGSTGEREKSGSRDCGEEA